MHIKSLCLSALMAATAAADNMFSLTGCHGTAGCRTTKTIWYNDFGGAHSGTVNFNEGCRDPGVPGVTWLCVDWNNKRGHFDALGVRRCFVQHYQSPPFFLAGNSATQELWREAPCKW